MINDGTIVVFVSAATATNKHVPHCQKLPRSFSVFPRRLCIDQPLFAMFNFNMMMSKQKLLYQQDIPD